MSTDNPKWTRRDFVRGAVAAGSLAGLPAGRQRGAQASPPEGLLEIDDFRRPDSLQIGEGWETLNPGYWEMKNGALRRRVEVPSESPIPVQLPWDWQLVRKNPEFVHDAVTAMSGELGDQQEELLATAPDLWPLETRLKLFPELDFFKDPSLPEGMLWRSDWKLQGNFAVRIETKIHPPRSTPVTAREAEWNVFSGKYGFVGICLGSHHLNESFNILGKALVAGWFEDGRFGIFQTQKRKSKYYLRQGLGPEQPFGDSAFLQVPPPRPGDRAAIEVRISGGDPGSAVLEATLTLGEKTFRVRSSSVERTLHTDGFVGVCARGLLDFEIGRFAIDPGANRRLEVGHSECCVCYPLGDSLREEDGSWKARFVAIFRSEGKEASLRISDQESPAEGWEKLPIAGRARIVSNAFRRNTALIDATLPFSPGDREMYFTVWKDGCDVTSDGRVGTDAVSAGSGLVGKLPETGNYVGRLPRLQAPYRVCGLSCHRVWDGRCYAVEEGRCEIFMDQPWPDSFQHLDDFGFQILLWEDDVWYLEYPIFPPTTDDSYRSILSHIAGPTSRWQMMRHWVVMNPGDHDYGVDDLAGPVQEALRQDEDLRGIGDYLQRNMRIVAHLMLGDDSPSITEAPTFWRRWQMPNRDFSLLTVDGRLWRSTPETRLWTDHEWTAQHESFDRHSSLRTILGERQFAWLQETIQTDTSAAICVSGINVLNPIYNQLLGPPPGPDRDAEVFDANCFDFAAWQSRPAERLLELFGSRDGIVTVYGDLHHAGICRNVRNRVVEAHFGYAGSSGYLRSPKHDFGQRMIDYNGEEIEVIAEYHQFFESPELKPRPQRPDRRRDAQNFLEMVFDVGEDRQPRIEMRIRNLLDPPQSEPRGGAALLVPVSETGRRPLSALPEIKTLPHAEVIFYGTDGTPIRGSRANAEGMLQVKGLVDIPPATHITMLARHGSELDARSLTTLPLQEET